MKPRRTRAMEVGKAGRVRDAYGYNNASLQSTGDEDRVYVYELRED